MEQREVSSETKAVTLVQQFATRFRSIDYTVHPADIPGEAAGKGSNMGWAARYLSAKYSTEVRKSVIVTGIDGMITRTFIMHYCAVVRNTFGGHLLAHCRDFC